MIKIIMHGCNGAMGRTITNIVREDNDTEIVAGIDLNTAIENEYPVFPSLAECKVEADVIIDFASTKAVSGLLTYAVEQNVPVVLCTTGLSKEQVEEVREASKKVAILRSANMSLGINMLLKLIKEAAKTLAPAGFDIEIVEKHHNKKIDAPSGTALALADSINEAMDGQYEYVYDRSRENKARNKKELGISAVRGGTIVGEHEIIFAGTDEVITFEHTAYSKAIFAKGSVSAAKYLAGRRAGLYDMSDVING
ncbi:MAG: 4-hydroxy-tetrahydrodipicolinate reductase [Clostridiales bacterium]|nr:4-hydroxy-tetrahydrodipicolinate reductase [Clostridiales bacterium]